MNLGEMRTRLRRDLKDEDPLTRRWTDEELDRHINHATLDVSRAAPLELEASLSTPEGVGKEIDVSGLEDLMKVDLVEYPVGKEPRRFCRFSVWGSKVTLLIDETPAPGEPVRVRYSAVHTLDASSCTMGPHLAELVAVGAGAYAALEWAAYSINQVNLGGAQTPGEYLKWAESRLNNYHKELSRLGRGSRLRAAGLFTEE